MIVNSSAGGGSKDTWVLDDGAGDGGRETDATLPRFRPPRLPDVRYGGGWQGQAQQQQQTGGTPPVDPLSA